MIYMTVKWLPRFFVQMLRLARVYNDSNSKTLLTQLSIMFDVSTTFVVLKVSCFIFSPSWLALSQVRRVKLISKTARINRP